MDRRPTGLKTLYNLLPHDLTYVASDGEIVLPRSRVARVEEYLTGSSQVETDRGIIRIDEESIGPVAGLPRPDGQTIYVVSKLLALYIAMSGDMRDDVVFPGWPVRDGDRRVVGSTNLVRIVGVKS
jgi:hypothetical protein